MQKIPLPARYDIKAVEAAIASAYESGLKSPTTSKYQGDIARLSLAYGVPVTKAISITGEPSSRANMHIILRKLEKYIADCKQHEYDQPCTPAKLNRFISVAEKAIGETLMTTRERYSAELHICYGVPITFSSQLCGVDVGIIERAKRYVQMFNGVI